LADFVAEDQINPRHGVTVNSTQQHGKNEVDVCLSVGDLLVMQPTGIEASPTSPIGGMRRS
jgi:hypothetical protein